MSITPIGRYPSNLIRSRLAICLVTIVLLFWIAPSGWSQTATLVGTIKDPSGAVVVGVSVSARHIETNIAHSGTTNEQGDYRIPLSRIGHYQVRAEQAGFKAALWPEVIVQLGQTLRLDMALEVGELAESVTVDSRAPLVRSETSSLGEVMDNRKILELPLNGREFLQLATLTPGVSNRNASAGSPSKGGALEVNGGRSGHNQFRLDGIDNTDNHYNELAAVPSIESIQEFQVVRNLYSAEYGRAGGGIIDVKLRSGTNQYHGSLYEFHRNSAVDARNFFAQTKPAFRFHQFGAAIGGPVYLPRYSGKDRSFFFFNYEGFRESKGTTSLWNMPTQQERQGDFSQSVIKPRNPFTGQPFPGNRIPSEMLSPLGTKLINLLPVPNSSDPLRNYVNSAQDTRDWNTYVVRFDQQLSQNRSVAVSWIGGTRKALQSNLNAYTAQVQPQNGYAAVLAFTQAFNPRTVFESRIGYTRLVDLVDNEDKTDYATQFGWPLHQNGATFWGFPRMSVRSPVGQQNYFGVNHSPFGRRNNAYNLVNSLSVNRGSHSLKMGLDVKRQHDNWVLMGSRNFFLNNYSTNVWADFAMGLASSVQFMPDVSWMYLRRTLWGMYVQDDWKVSPRLTLNLGLRYDVNTPYKSLDRRMATFDVATGQLVYPEAAPLTQADLARLRFPHRVAGPATAYDTDWKSIGPRFGLAFRPRGTNDLVVRGGYGIFYAPASGLVTAYTAFVPPWQARIALAGTPQSPVFIDKIPVDYFNGPLNDSGSVLYVPASRKFRDLGSQQWNLSIEKEILSDLALEIAYIGSKQTHASGLTDGHFFAQQYIGRPRYPGMGNLTLRTDAYNMEYNALQVTARQRLAHGLSFLLNYTWSKALSDQSGDDANVIPDFSDLRQIWGRADFDVRHIFNFSGIYEIPVGANRRFLSQSGGLANAILGGWKLNYIVQATSGYPFSLSVSGAAALVRPDILPGKQGNLPSSQRTPDFWFDPSVFTFPATRFGNVAKNTMDGPGYATLDLGVSKNFVIREGRLLEFRTEMFNALNHPNFYFTAFFDPAFNVPGANRPNAVRDPRSIQFALKFLF
ncbi:MAG: TonB-dependent receptor [Acidobacteria bacterium]|nr:TonB-dependent receptor [Acidobacteriota bacterium]MCI0720535.1 TonB-dependent receptor [Acidobacteriota bacterium]